MEAARRGLPKFRSRAQGAGLPPFSVDEPSDLCVLPSALCILLYFLILLTSSARCPILLLRPTLAPSASSLVFDFELREPPRDGWGSTSIAYSGSCCP